VHPERLASQALVQKLTATPRGVILRSAYNIEGPTGQRTHQCAVVLFRMRGGHSRSEGSVRLFDDTVNDCWRRSMSSLEGSSRHSLAA